MSARTAWKKQAGIFPFAKLSRMQGSQPSGWLRGWRGQSAAGHTQKWDAMENILRIGLLGGTFNPPHRAHMALARAALGDGRVDRVAFVPAGQPPHKTPGELPPPGHRRAMVALLTREDPRFDLFDLELRRPGPSYTVDTVRALRAARPDARFRLIVGWDMARSFDSWREAGALAQYAPPLVAWRPDDGPASRPDPSELPAVIRPMAEEGYLAMPPSTISSTHIRARLRAGAGDAELAAWLPDAVLAYIRRFHLYPHVE